jgi:hypothetical protein
MDRPARRPSVKKSNARPGNATPIRPGTILAGVDRPMKVLEARFHPHSKGGGTHVTVARVLCDGQQATVEAVSFPSRRIEPFEATAIFDRLNRLVGSAAPRPYTELTQLRSEFWTFVDVDGDV